MMAQLIDRKQVKAEMKDLLSTAQVSPKGMVALYLGLSLVLAMADYLAGGIEAGLLGIFVSVLASLLNMVLGAGFVLYCMAVRRGERAEYLTLFDGFSFVGKVIALNLVIFMFVFLWSMLFLVPGIIAGYRYRFALLNLYENPGIGVMEALDMSKRQTLGYKGQLFMLDLSYFGWTLLASLPVAVESGFTYQQMAQSAALYMTDPSLAMAQTYTSLFGLPGWAWTLLCGIWSLAVALFYLSTYQCAELSYFETAKNTSGIGLNAVPPQEENPWNDGPGDGPDGLGGL